MSDLRALAHLEEQLGEARWQALISSGNTGKIKEFLDTLPECAIPTEMILGGVAYDILSFLRGEQSVKGDLMVERAKEMGAHQGKKEREHLLAYQDEIPVALRGKVVFVFTDDRRPGGPEYVCCVCWDDDRWVSRWDWLDGGFFGRCRVLRRKSAQP
ncbi:MAG: hypothetical protein HYV42_05235 [Candidatus Magasanikbacteria bacterium]|nr:hypothetical protein [Candidatus Magasanikbacteria bacterium]